ncbi:ABC transporter permease, partial [Nosocomiicoccus massiliensis]|uniref:ABC transporter permease n=1 Tax=Nosocomiicoccus massiliensis TaxID=1232430 RepID=UPI001651FBD3
MDKDISKRMYYMKFIFNSHFLIFLTIALGAFFYSLFELRDVLHNNIYVDMLVAVLVALSITPTYRSLLKEADLIFLVPVEDELNGYFKRAERYSLVLSYIFPVVMVILTFMLVLINHTLIEFAIFSVAVIVTVYLTFKIKVETIHTLLNT